MQKAGKARVWKICTVSFAKQTTSRLWDHLNLFVERCNGTVAHPEANSSEARMLLPLNWEAHIQIKMWVASKPQDLQQWSEVVSDFSAFWEEMVCGCKIKVPRGIFRDASAAISGHFRVTLQGALACALCLSQGQTMNWLRLNRRAMCFSQQWWKTLWLESWVPIIMWRGRQPDTLENSTASTELSNHLGQVVKRGRGAVLEGEWSL